LILRVVPCCIFTDRLHSWIWNSFLLGLIGALDKSLGYHINPFFWTVIRFLEASSLEPTEATMTNGQFISRSRFSQKVR
jgi:hypothetical protein